MTRTHQAPLPELFDCAFCAPIPVAHFCTFLFVVTVLVSQLVTFPVTGSFQGIPLEGPDFVTAFVANIFMLQGLAAGKLSWNYPAWSISVEFMAYLAFPFALSIIWRASNMGKIILAFFALAALAWLAFLKSSNFDQWDGPITLLRCLPEFLLGSLLYFGFRTSPRNCWLNQDALAFGIVVATVLCLHLDAPDLLIVALFAVLIPIAVVNTGVFAKFANVGPLIWLGEVSYSLSCSRVGRVRLPEADGCVGNPNCLVAFHWQLPGLDACDGRCLLSRLHRNLFWRRDRVETLSSRAVGVSPEPAGWNS